MINEPQPSQIQSSPPDNPLWEFVTLNDYRQPSAFAANAAKLKWVSFKRFFKRFNTENQPPLKNEDELQSLSRAHLKYLVAEIDWTGASEALDAALENWLETLPPNPAVKFIISPPHAGLTETLNRWITLHNAYRVDAPNRTQILNVNHGWLDNWPIKDQLWVLPQLEHCYLRHAQGLEAIRRFFEMAVVGDLGHGLVGCDSWSWAYLQHIWPIEQSEVLTLQGFDGSRLKRLFLHLASEAEQKKLWFRNARTGATVMLQPAQQNNQVSPDLNQLAVYCRGNFGLARVYWRDRLRAEPEQTLDAKEKNEMINTAISSEEQCIWVNDMPREPIFPNEDNDDLAFILHALLLHNGLPAALLPELLPLSYHRVMMLLLNLKSLNIVTLKNGLWKVTAFGYLGVREYLRARDFLLDAF